MRAKRSIMAAVGVIITSICVGFFKMAAFGVDPFQSLVSGAFELLPCSYGTVSMLLTAALLIFTLLADRHYIGITTAVNMFLLGYIAEYTHKFLLFLSPNASMAIRILCFVIGFIGLCFGSAIYITADMGVSTYDSVSLIMADTWHWGKFKYIRICTDLVCVIGGCTLFLLGGGTIQDVPTIIGFGTIATAFCMGPLVDFFNRTVAQPMLYGKKCA